MYIYNKYNSIGKWGVKGKNRKKDMDIAISSNSGRPIYEQIISQIKTMILNGSLQPGDGIPSMRTLAKTIDVSVITVQRAYEDLQREGFIETTVGRGSFVSVQDRGFYQREQRRRAKERLAAAAEIGRMGNISLAELTELLKSTYEKEEGRILKMKEFLLEKTNTDGEVTLSAVGQDSSDAVYTLLKKKDSLLTESFTVQSKSGGDVADIKMEHILLTPARLPKLTISTKKGKSFIVKKEMEQLADVIHIEGESLTIRGETFSEHFELLCGDRCIAEYTYDGTKKAISTDEEDELTAVLFAFALELSK